MTRALVTGAASGIGRATAYELAERGARLVLVDVDAAGLERTARMVEPLGGRVVLTERLDVGDRSAMLALSLRVERTVGELDVLVNNAGIGIGGDFVDTPLGDWDRVVSVNLMGVVHGCHFFLPRMIEAGSGHVFNVASLAGLVAAKGMSAYAATKFAVVGLSQSLAAEVHGAGIRVTAVCPGFVNTPITRRSTMVGAYVDDELRAGVVRMYRKRSFGPELVARAIVGAIGGPSGVLPVTAEAQVLSRLQRFAPALVARINRRLDPFRASSARSR